MKIKRIYVDGFGPFFGQEFGEFDDGLNIILGENEAGKSTLLDFIRGVFYGFADGKNPKRQHLPLRGGKHGGRLMVVDDNSVNWTIERYAKSLIVTSASGESGSDKTLTELLGHTDDRIYQSIFAFGLSELEDIKRLTDDNIRDAIFSAGVVGGGRSATAAMKQLDDERSEITRTGRGIDKLGILQRLFAERTELDRQVRGAKDDSESFEGLSRKINQQQDAIDEVEARLRTYQSRVMELGDLEKAAKFLESRDALVDQIQVFTTINDTDRLIANERSVVDELHIRFDGYQNTKHELDAKIEQLADRERQADDLVAQIGLTRQACLNAKTDIALRDEVAQLTTRHVSLTRQMEVQQKVRAEAQNEMDRCADELPERSDAEHTPPTESLSDQIEDLSTLRSMVHAFEQKNHELALFDERVRGSKNPRGNSLWPFAALFMLMGLLGIAMVIVTTSHGDRLSSSSGILGIAVLLLGLVGAIFVLKGIKTPTPDTPEGFDQRKTLNDLALRIGELAATLSLAALPTEAEITAQERILREGKDRAETFAANLGELKRATDKLSKIDETISSLDQEIHEVVQQTSILGHDLGISNDLDPATLGHIVQAIDELKALIKAAFTDKAALDNYRDKVAKFDHEVAQLFLRCGLKSPVHETTQYALTELRERCIAIVDTIANHEDLLDKISRIDGQIDALFQTSEDEKRLREELASLTPGACENELLALSIEIDAAKEEFGTKIKHKGELEGELKRLQGSDTIMTLETELVSINSVIDVHLRRWALLGASSFLLKRTLSRYETERQPAVISRAAELFAEVTRGRYNALIPREEPAGRRTLEVWRADGGHIDSTLLSSGTQQQLYLCVRLAYAENFSERATSLPLVLDDVLVNFDPVRSLEVTRAITKVATMHQVLLFTCHPHTVETFAQVGDQPRVIELPSRM